MLAHEANATVSDDRVATKYADLSTRFYRVLDAYDLQREKGIYFLSAGCKELYTRHLSCFCDCFFAMRQLHWVWGQGSASVSVQFAEPASTKSLVVTTLQAVVLLAFNVRPKFTVAELIAMTGLDMDVMKRIVGSLSAVKGVAIVNKTPKGARISETDVVELDSTFKHPKREFALPAPFFDNISERTGPSKEVCEDRKYMVDACIVRTMKARNCMEHQVQNIFFYQVSNRAPRSSCFV